MRLAAGTRAVDDDPMTSNIEPLAREMAMRICRRSGMGEADIPRWVDLHWPCAAAMLEAGVMDGGGEWVEDKDVRLCMEAYRDRLQRSKSAELLPVPGSIVPL